MWRPAHGATTRPGPSRPASGYGRAIGRPQPELGVPIEPPAVERRALEPSMFIVPPAPLESDVESDVEAPAVTP